MASTSAPRGNSNGGTHRMKSAASTFYSENQSLVAEIRKAITLMKEVAVDLEKDNHSQMVKELEDSVTQLLEASENCTNFSSAVQSVGNHYQLGEELTNFSKLFDDEIAKSKASSSSVPQNLTLLRQFKEAIWPSQPTHRKREREREKERKRERRTSGEPQRHSGEPPATSRRRRTPATVRRTPANLRRTPANLQRTSSEPQRTSSDFTATANLQRLHGDHFEHVHHAGQPMPGEEQEDIVMTSTQCSLLNITCPLSGKPVTELAEPVRSMDCKHVYEKKAIMHYLKSKNTQSRCPVAGCPKILMAERIACDPLLLVEIDELRSMSKQTARADVIEDFTDVDEEDSD